MASLLDPLSDDVRTLVRVAADGYAAAGSVWPYWQWVRQQLWTGHGLDGEEVLKGMPTRAERAKTARGLPQFGSDWGAAWNHLRATAVQALDTVREEISPLAD